MNRLSDQPFAGSGLAAQQHRRARRGDLCDLRANLTDQRAVSHQACRVWFWELLFLVCPAMRRDRLTQHRRQQGDVVHRSMEVALGVEKVVDADCPHDATIEHDRRRHLRHLAGITTMSGRARGGRTLNVRNHERTSALHEPAGHAGRTQCRASRPHNGVPLGDEDLGVVAVLAEKHDHTSGDADGTAHGERLQHASERDLKVGLLREHLADLAEDRQLPRFLVIERAGLRLCPRNRLSRHKRHQATRSVQASFRDRPRISLNSTTPCGRRLRTEPHLCRNPRCEQHL